ncbi:MAG: bifunctional glutamate N-acetyltransferase/amino-acid acetyltransferase ArgJ [Proteobacteria bacterium]|nr:bifunctional glutamate N-acetyltransferase/amino-acid acetyltransferase ArgJ [Pseudomonadota bacterium]MBU4009456.1 bifunctional glutamate N-acetyltransferase/amino-acid acetyltransferase ArgJ [Pseudomonadota bacterium]
MENLQCKGFTASGVISGLKKNGRKDLGLIYSEVPANVAGVFTRNKVQAAPVILDRQRIKSGICQAFIANSGSANCCTGDQGMKDAVSEAGFAASGLNIAEELVLVASTGVIGKPLELDKIKTAVPSLVKSLSTAGINDFTQAIMTTDTVPKIVSVKGDIGGCNFYITGVAKGAGMICPDMATMLCFIITDVKADSDFLKESLISSTDKSFNRITIDGDTSTNDTVLIMANGMSGVDTKSVAGKEYFRILLDEVMIKLAKMVVKDGEGATKLVDIVVNGAASESDAKKIASVIANSNLVKTALFGEDANWGRILAAAGRAGAAIEPDSVDIYFDNVLMVKNGSGCGDDAEAEATKILKKPEFTIKLDLKLGNAKASVFTCDFSIDYVKINADYRS